MTRERTSIVTRRAEKLKIQECHQGILDKLPVVKNLLARHHLTAAQACYIGDDVGDLEAMRHVGLPVARHAPSSRRQVLTTKCANAPSEKSATGSSPQA